MIKIDQHTKGHQIDEICLDFSITEKKADIKLTGYSDQNCLGNSRLLIQPIDPEPKKIKIVFLIDSEIEAVSH